ncbi:MAG: CHAT domain-containing protein [Cyanothece sp. SIO2G6]|nr:CHAT domain-containing protein [Cyanothece sp. SIO2G6]
MARKWLAIQRTSQTLLKKWWWYWLFGMSFAVVVGLALITPAIESDAIRESPQRWIEQSQVQLSQGDLSGAIHSQQIAVNLLRQIPEQQVNVAISLTNLGGLYAQVGQFRTAYENLTEAAALYPEIDGNYLQNRRYQVQVLRQLGQYQTACLQMVDTLWWDHSTSPGRSLCETGTADATTLAILLATLDPIITQQPAALQATLLRELGITLGLLGHLDTAEQVLSRFTDGPTQLAWANIKRAQGNLIRDRLASPRYDAMPWRFERETFSFPDLREGKASSPEYQTMMQSYQQAEQYYAALEQRVDREQQPDSGNVQIEAKLNHLRLLLDQIMVLDAGDAQMEPMVNRALDLAQTIDIDTLPIGQSSLFAHIALAKQQAFLNQILNTEAISWNHIQKLLDKAKTTAELLGNSHALSYVLGNMGSLYEYFAWLDHSNNLETLQEFSTKSTHPNVTHPTASQWQQLAIQLSEAALVEAQPAEAPEIAYQWQWQLGRLAMGQGDRSLAIAHYEAAVNTLEAVRKDLLTINADVRFSFRDDIEPVYRGLVGALLTAPSTTGLQAAIDTIDGLQLAELENFLGCSLNSTLQIHQRLDEIDPKAGFIYPIILSDRLEIITKLPGQPLTHHAEFIAPAVVENTLNQFRKQLLTIDGTPSNQSNQQASDEQIYDWLLRPVEDAIAHPDNIDIIVFVPDSAFRNLSPSALYDAEHQQYVLDKPYATVLLPSVQLFDLGQAYRNPTVLAVGISEQQTIENKVFQTLDAEQEIATIQSIIPKTFSLLNEQANPFAIADKLVTTAPSVLHFASHGKFSSDPDETYIVIYQDLLKSDQLDNLLQTSPSYARGLDLLTLATCQSATGDNRAVLGLAGVAVNANARSTLASLWNTNDAVTIQLMQHFYQEFSDPTVKRATALHHAQQAIRQSPGLEAPYFWAPFTLIGNWQ